MTSTLEVGVRNLWQLCGGPKYGLRILRYDHGDMVIFISGMLLEDARDTVLAYICDLTYSFASWEIPFVMQPTTTNGEVKSLMINVRKADVQRVEQLLK